MLQDNIPIPDDTWELLSPSLTENRKTRMQEVASKRTNLLRLALQDIHDPHNVSACMRSAEAMGINNVDVVSIKKNFKATGPSRGTRHWSNVHNWLSVEECVKNLKKEGYLLCAGLPRPDAKPISQIPIDKPVCIIFGNEHDGIDNSWLDHIDIPFTIPMVGMVESLNISVAAAISMFDVTRRLRDFHPQEKYYISDKEKMGLLNKWAFSQCRDPIKQMEILRKKNSFNP